MVYFGCMSNGINPGPDKCDPQINAKPSGGGRVGPALVYPKIQHPLAKKGGRTGSVSDAMKGYS